MERTEEEILKETGGIMTSESTRGARYGDEPTEEPTEEDVAGENKHNLNGDL